MQKTFNFFYAFLLAILGFGATLMAEDITLTTYYPAPYGVYDELSVSQQQEKPPLEPKTSALTVSSTTTDTLTMPLISASTKSNGMLLDSEDTTDSYYILNIRSGAPLASRFYVRNDGNVGIGSTSPSAALDVSGTINATGYSADGTAGFDGTFLTGDGRTVTVTDGIITSIL